MKDINLKDAFGQTPESVRQCVARSLRQGDRRETQMKHSVPKLVFVTAIIVVLLGTAAFAAGRLGVMEQLTTRQGTNESAAVGVQSVVGEYSGDAVRVTMNDALYDSKMNYYGVSWIIENIRDDEALYVITDDVTFGGELAHMRAGYYTSEFMLPVDETMGSALGELPGNGSTVGEIQFTVLRVLAPVEEIPTSDTIDEYNAEVARVYENGAIPQEGDGYLVPAQYDPEKTYAENLLATGKFEMADQFAITFTLQDNLLDDTYKTYEGEKNFVFDGYELRIREAHMSAMGAYIQVEYITPEALVDHGKGIGYLYSIDFTDPSREIWTGNSSGSFEDPVQLEDGRYMHLYTFEATQLFNQPDVLEMTLVTYDLDFNPTVYSEDTVELQF